MNKERKLYEKERSERILIAVNYEGEEVKKASVEVVQYFTALERR